MNEDKGVEGVYCMPGTRQDGGREYLAIGADGKEVARTIFYGEGDEKFLSDALWYFLDARAGPGRKHSGTRRPKMKVIR